MSRYRTEPNLVQLAGGILGTLIWRFASTLPARFRWTLGRTLGFVIYLFAKSRRKVVRRNLELCFPNQSQQYRDSLAVECFRQAGCGILSWGFGLFANPEKIHQQVQWTGRETLDELISNKVSVIVLCPHFVSAMVALRALVEFTPAVAMYDAPMNPVFNLGYKIAMEGYQSKFKSLNWLYRHQAANPVTMLHFRHNPRPILKALDQAIPFFYLPDQNAKIKAQQVFAPFFGIQAATYGSLSKLARYRNSRIVMCCPLLLPKQRGFELHIALLPSDFLTGDVEQDAAKMNDAIEQLVKDVPEQYFWLHRRFKIRPEGEPDLYD